MDYLYFQLYSHFEVKEESLSTYVGETGSTSSTSIQHSPAFSGIPFTWMYVKIRIYRMKWCELREYKWNEYVTIAVNRNLSNCEKARKKGFRGFNGIRTRGLCISAAVLYQPELWRPIHWRPANCWVHQPVKGMKHRMKWCELREYKWNEYVTIAVNRNLSNCEKARKNAMVTYSFHLYSRSSHHFILCFIPFTGWWTQ